VPYIFFVFLTFLLQDFAFAEYENADSALRALRLLNNMDMGTGKLSLKCDTKTQAALQEHHRVKIQKVIITDSAALLYPASHALAGNRCHFVSSCPERRFPSSQERVCERACTSAFLLFLESPPHSLTL
jgi:hypothetical protein